MALERRLRRLLDSDDRPLPERERLLRLMLLFAERPAPPDPLRLFPRYSELKEQFLGAASGQRLLLVLCPAAPPTSTATTAAASTAAASTATAAAADGTAAATIP